ncbi:MAG: extracellular solute-binding protein [Chloroflexi bacterium]|nr:extracellular solute-binding protein [Chloroflexota bacterium]
MSRLLSGVVLVILAGLLFSGCGPSVSPAPAEEARAPAGKAPAVVSRSAPEQRWDDLVAGARKEAKLSFMGSVGGPFRELGVDKFLSDKFGITMEIMAGGASELIPKLAAQRRAGLHVGDAFMLSTSSMLNGLKPNDITDSLEQIIFLPEVLDSKAWYQGGLPWVDKDRHQVTLLAMPVAPLVINTDLVKPGEMKSYRDLLNPKWKGRIGMMDPTQSGSANIWFTAMAEGLMDVSYLREFGRQEPVLSRNDRLMGESIAKGKYAVMVGLGTKIVAEFKRLGSPIEAVIPAEGTYVATDSAGITMLKNPEHPNAAKLFVNWVLTKEGITWVAKAYGGQSARVDVPTDFLDPDKLRQPGVKYLDANTEEFALKQPGYYKLAAEILIAPPK